MSNTGDNEDPIGRRIVEAAAVAFTEHGFAGVSTATIARQAKTSKREIYERFQGKDALFEEVMKYLCSLGASATPNSQPDHDGVVDPDDAFRDSARAVLTRFALPETHGVLAAAIGARSQFPSVLKIFWDQGPGQAVDQIVAAMQDQHARGEIRAADFRDLATCYIHDCCGPVVLHQLFDTGFVPGADYIDSCIDRAHSRLLERIRT